MANNNNNQQTPFWEFIQSFDPSMRAGVGVDHTNAGNHIPQGFPFDASQFNNPLFGHGWGQWGAGQWGPGHHGGRHGHQGYRDVPDSDREEDHDDEMDGTPETMRPTPDSSTTGDVPPTPPPGAFPHHPPPPSGASPHHPPPPPGAPHQHPHPPSHHGHPSPFGPHRGRGGWGGRGGRCGRGARHGPPPAYSGPWDFRPLMHAFASHPFAQAFRDHMDQTRSGQSNEHQDDVFVPPVDVFNTEKAYVLHVSLPGAVKEDVGVNWDGEKVSIAGVVYRPGNEEFLQSLTSSERKVGMFERSIKLPPPGTEEKEEVDGFSITAKMENGILIVTVPKTEKEWTEIHKVDIE
ncbi:HSP20-like chaperone [Hypoxylon cercidicola]|nr:HSP20-like chaperone [Hypoxylon cercidicola]